MRAFAFTDQSQTESIHDVPGVVAFLGNPVHHYLFLSFNAEIFDSCYHFGKLGHMLGGIFLPTFLHRLFIILHRSDKEETANIPQFTDEADAVFHHADYRHHRFERSLYTVFFKDGQEKPGYLFIRFQLDILVIEPDSFLIIELGTRLAATVQVEQSNQFIHRHYLLIVTGIPSQQGKEIDYRLRQVTRFTVSGRNFVRLRIVPFEGEYGETETVTVTLAQLAVPFRF